MIEEKQTNMPDKEESFQEHCLTLLEKIAQNQIHVNQQLTDFESQSAFFRQQLGQSLESLNQQQINLNNSEVALRTELKKFQTGGPKRAMAAVFHKFFRDLLKHMNQLDGLNALIQENDPTSESRAWLESIQALRGQFENLLVQWGCHPMPIEENVTLFDPEYHESIETEDLEIPASTPANTIVKVHQRGWLLQDFILQYPEVVVS